MVNIVVDVYMGLIMSAKWLGILLIDANDVFMSVHLKCHTCMSWENKSFKQIKIPFECQRQRVMSEYIYWLIQVLCVIMYIE